MSYIGRFILVTALCAHTYLTFQDQSAQSAFSSNFNKFLQLHPLLNHLLVVKPHLEYVRQGILALIGLSFLTILKNSQFITYLNILGVVLYTAVMANPLITPGELTLIQLLKNVSIVGGLIVVFSQSGSTSSAPSKVQADKKGGKTKKD